jgi:hypothetical protein
MGMEPELSVGRWVVLSRYKTALFLGEVREPTAFPVGLLSPRG